MSKKLVFIVVFLSGVLLFGKGAYIQLKALYAQHLIEESWSKTIEANGTTKVSPWSWSDTYPVAKLEVPRLDVKQYILHGSNGPTLAFGAGVDVNSYLPRQGGTTIVGGHRDTSFSFLENVEVGDIVNWEDPTGKVHTYYITKTKIIDSSKEGLNVTEDVDELILVTCYPFDAIQSGGDKRFVATAMKSRS